MKGISIAARKAKGRKTQQECRDMVLRLHPDLSSDDVRSCPMGSTGADLMMSPKAKEAFPFSVEVKRRATGFTPIYDALEQADRDDGLTPLVYARQDRKWAFVVMYASDFESLMSDQPQQPSKP